MKKLLLMCIVSLSFIACSNKYETIIKKDLQEKSSFDEDLKYKSISLEVKEVSTSEYKKELNDQIDNLFTNVFLLEESNAKEMLIAYKETLSIYDKYNTYTDLRAQLDKIINDSNYKFKTVEFLSFYNELCGILNRAYSELDLSTLSKNVDIEGNIKTISNIKYQMEFVDKAAEIPNYWTRVTNKFSFYNPVLKAQVKQTALLILNDKGEVYSIDYTIDN